jgi:Flp pilus assembly protein TadG
MRHISQTDSPARRGAAMVEMAIVLPIFVLVSLGVVEFGRALMVANMVTNSAREGARMAVLDGSTNTEVTKAVTDFLTSTLNVKGGDVTVGITITPAAGNPNPNNQCASAKARDLIAINVQVPYSKVALIPAKFLGSTTLHGASAMRHE